MKKPLWILSIDSFPNPSTTNRRFSLTAVAIILAAIVFFTLGLFRVPFPFAQVDGSQVFLICNPIDELELEATYRLAKKLNAQHSELSPSIVLDKQSRRAFADVISTQEFETHELDEQFPLEISSVVSDLTAVSSSADESICLFLNPTVTSTVEDYAATIETSQSNKFRLVSVSSPSEFRPNVRIMLPNRSRGEEEGRATESSMTLIASNLDRLENGRIELELAGVDARFNQKSINDVQAKLPDYLTLERVEDKKLVVKFSGVEEKLFQLFSPRKPLREKPRLITGTPLHLRAAVYDQFDRLIAVDTIQVDKQKPRLLYVPYAAFMPSEFIERELTGLAPEDNRSEALLGVGQITTGFFHKTEHPATLFNTSVSDIVVQNSVMDKIPLSDDFEQGSLYDDSEFDVVVLDFSFPYFFKSDVRSFEESKLKDRLNQLYYKGMPPKYLSALKAFRKAGGTICILGSNNIFWDRERGPLPGLVAGNGTELVKELGLDLALDPSQSHVSVLSDNSQSAFDSRGDGFLLTIPEITTSSTEFQDIVSNPSDATEARQSLTNQQYRIWGRLPKTDSWIGETAITKALLSKLGYEEHEIDAELLAFASDVLLNTKADFTAFVGDAVAARFSHPSFRTSFQGESVFRQGKQYTSTAPDKSHYTKLRPTAKFPNFFKNHLNPRFTSNPDDTSILVDSFELSAALSYRQQFMKTFPDAELRLVSFLDQLDCDRDAPILTINEGRLSSFTRPSSQSLSEDDWTFLIGTYGSDSPELGFSDNHLDHVTASTYWRSITENKRGTFADLCSVLLAEKLSSRQLKMTEPLKGIASGRESQLSWYRLLAEDYLSLTNIYPKVTKCSDDFVTVVEADGDMVVGIQQGAGEGNLIVGLLEPSLEAEIARVRLDAAGADWEDYAVATSDRKFGYRLRAKYSSEFIQIQITKHPRLMDDVSPPPLAHEALRDPRNPTKPFFAGNELTCSLCLDFPNEFDALHVINIDAFESDDGYLIPLDTRAKGYDKCPKLREFFNSVPGETPFGLMLFQTGENQNSERQSLCLPIRKLDVDESSAGELLNADTLARFLDETISLLRTPYSIDCRVSEDGQFLVVERVGDVRLDQISVTSADGVVDPPGFKWASCGDILTSRIPDDIKGSQISITVKKTSKREKFRLYIPDDVSNSAWPHPNAHRSLLDLSQLALDSVCNLEDQDGFDRGVYETDWSSTLDSASQAWVKSIDRRRETAREKPWFAISAFVASLLFFLAARRRKEVS